MRRPKGDLVAYWNDSARDLMYNWDKHPPDGHLLHGALNHTPVHDGRSLVQELEARGYDITTLRFSIKRKRV